MKRRRTATQRAVVRADGENSKGNDSELGWREPCSMADRNRRWQVELANGHKSRLLARSSALRNNSDRSDFRFRDLRCPTVERRRLEGANWLARAKIMDDKNRFSPKRGVRSADPRARFGPVKVALVFQVWAGLRSAVFGSG
jgi:hypothetical protein